MDSQVENTLMPVCIANKIQTYDSNAIAQWTALLFKENKQGPAFMLDLIPSAEPIQPLPILMSKQAVLYSTSLSVSKDTKMEVLAKFEKKCSCDEINNLMKNYLIVNLELSGMLSLEYQVVGYQSGSKVVGNNKFAEILIEELEKAKATWAKYQGSYCRSFGDKKNKNNEAKELTFQILPFLQCGIDVVLKPNNIEGSAGFHNLQIFCKTVPILFSIIDELDSPSINKIIRSIVHEQVRMQSLPKIGRYFAVMGARGRLPSKIFNPHIFAKPAPKNNFEFITVKGIYQYFHYGDQNFSDNGWGCAYRAHQTLLSWLNLQGHLLPMETHMITIRDIQNKLDMIDRSRKLTGSSEWIGATQISWLVPKMTTNQVNCKILHVSDGKKILQKCEEFKQHFLTSGCPIMYGGGEYAYSIVGMHYNWKLGECDFLILDPHYTGEDDYGKIIEKKGLAWRKPQQMFKKGIFYNFCLPIVN